MSATQRWMPHPHRTYHVMAPDGRMEAFRGSEVEAALEAAPPGARVWMQGADAWVDPRSTLLRGRWSRVSREAGSAATWVSERAYAARLNASWSLTRLTTLDAQARDADPFGTWLPGEPGYVRAVQGRDIEAAEADIARWLAALHAPEPDDRRAAADLLTAALQRANAFHERDERVRVWIARTVPLLDDPDRSIVAAAARLLQVDVAEVDVDDDYEAAMWVARRSAYAAAGGPAAWRRALAGPMDASFGWVAQVVRLEPDGARDNEDVRTPLLDGLDSACAEAQIGALMGMVYVAVPERMSEQGIRLQSALERCAKSEAKALRVLAGRVGATLWENADAAPDWLLAAVVETMSYLLEAQAQPSTWVLASEMELMEIGLEMDSVWLGTKAHLYARTGVVDVCLRAVEAGSCAPGLAKLLEQPAGVRDFMAIGGASRVGKACEKDQPNLNFACSVFALALYRLGTASDHAKRLAAEFAREFCWGRIAAWLRGSSDAIDVVNALLAVCNVAADAANTFARHADAHACIEAVGLWLEPRGDAELDTYNADCAALALGYFALEPALRPAVRAFLPRLRQLAQHPDEELSRRARNAVQNCG